MIKRWFVLLYATFCYACFLAAALYLFAWLGNFALERSIDAERQGSMVVALLTNLSLIGLFAAQHSVMARPAFKRWWTRFVPAPVERSTYVLATCLVLLVLFFQWRPLGVVIWDLEQRAAVTAAYALYAAGWMTVLASTFLIHHGDLFGLRQAWLYFRRRPYSPLRFATPGLYRYVRHPLYIGWMMAFWATPTMTISHLVFAAGMTLYMLAAIPLEERDLADLHGQRYREYRQRVGRLFPRVWARGKVAGPESSR